MFDKAKWLKRFRREHADVMAKWQHDYYIRNRSTVLEKHRRHNKKVRDQAKFEVLTHYSGGVPQCSCCGERTITFLSLDHVDGDGKRHRQNCGMDLYLFLKRRGFPKKPRLQVLCFNCNLGRSVNGGVCPHKTICLTTKTT